MLMTKAVGLMCIFGACVLAGVQMEHSLKRRWLFFREMKETLLLLEQEMTWYRTPLSEALKNAANVCRTPLGPMLLCCAGQVETRNGQPFEEIWKSSAGKYLPDELLRDSSDSQILFSTADALCCTDPVLQKTYMQKYIQRFDALCSQAREDWQEKGGLYRKLSAALGAAIVIFLL